MLVPSHRHSPTRIRLGGRALGLGLVISALVLSGCGNEDSAAGSHQGASHGPGRNGGSDERSLPTVPVAIVSAHRGAIASYYSTTATLEASREAEVLARVTGVVLKILVEEGSQVREGQPLLRIDPQEYDLRLRQSQSEVARHKSRFDRSQQMIDGNYISQEEYEAVLNDLAAAEASRDLAELELSYTTVVAPFSGDITRRDVDAGQHVSTGVTLFSLADLEPLLARVHVPAREFRRIRTDQTVDLTLDSTGRQLSGTITLVSPVIDPQSGTIKITVEIPEYPPDTRPGDFAEVRIVTEHHTDALLVPKISVVTEKGQPVVYVAGQDSTAQRRTVEVGFQDDQYAEIIRGVEAGESVVVQGQRSLRPGQPMKILDPLTFEAEKSDSTGKEAAS